MPLYDFIDESTGQKVELLVPIAQRDQVPGHRRLAVPPRLNTVGFAEDIHSQAYGARKGLKEMESAYGRDRIVRDTGFSVNQLRQTWAA